MVSRGAFGLCILFLMAFTACGGDENPPEPVVYDDPETQYGPPEINVTSGKADSISGHPKITKVSWQPDQSCSVESIGAVEIVIEVKEGDTDTEELLFDGAVTGCNGTQSDYGPMISSARSVLTCHNVSDHRGLITVIDPQGRGDSVTFQFRPCSRGTFRPDSP